MYAQHKHAEQRPWNQVERVGEQPVVYPARGSHACYFSRASTGPAIGSTMPTGSGPVRPSTLQIISDTSAADAWATWPGMWGAHSRLLMTSIPLDDSSPRGPGGHAQYRKPDRCCKPRSPTGSLAPPPPAAARRQRRRSCHRSRQRPPHRLRHSRRESRGPRGDGRRSAPGTHRRSIASRSMPAAGRRHPGRRSRPGDRSRQGHCRRRRLAGNTDEAG